MQLFYPPKKLLTCSQLQNKHTLAFITSMQSTVSTTSTTLKSKQKRYVADWVFVIQLHNGKFVIGSSNNPVKKIAAINTGFYRAVPKSLQVNRVIGIKEQNEERSLMSVTKKFCDKYGEDNVIVI